MSRRAADEAVKTQRIVINDLSAQHGQEVTPNDRVTFDGKPVAPPARAITIILNKPRGFVSSREGQGSKTVYDLLPPELHSLKTVGRLDKDSSGLLLLTSDGILANSLTHPSYQKEKIYQVEIDKPLRPNNKEQIEKGVDVNNEYLSRLRLSNPMNDGHLWQVTMTEGRNRQIRRTFEALGYRVKKLHRTHFGPYALGELASGQFRIVSSDGS